MTEALEISLRFCPRCEQNRPESAFARSSRRTLQTYCRRCNTDYKRECRRRVWIGRLWTQYRLRPVDYVGMLARQGGRCALCSHRMDPPVVDHDHRCCPGGKQSCGRCVRSLLCRKCNTNMGWIETQPDPVAFLEKIRSYVDVRAERVTGLAEEEAKHHNSKPL